MVSLQARAGDFCARPRGPGLRRWCLTWAAVLACALPFSVGATKLRFRAAPDTGVSQPSPVSQQVLSPDEQAFLRSLPALRVAISTPPSRPFEIVSADGEVSGVFPDLLTALAKTFGLRLQAVPMPSWSASLDAARRREVDIIMSVGVTPERMDYLAFTLGAVPVQGALFARTGARVDLANARIALERDFMTNDWAARQYPRATIVTVETTAAALQAVAKGQADVYVGGLLEAVDTLSRQPVPGVEVQQLVSYGTGFYHFGVRKDWAPLATILNKGIQTRRDKIEGDLLSLATTPSGHAVQRVLRMTPAESDLLARQPVWRVGAVRGLHLLNDVDARGLHSGIAAEYTEQVARRLGVAVQLVAFDSVALMIQGLQAGEVDLVPFLNRTEERAQRLAFSKPYVEMPYALVARDDAALYWNLASLAGKRLALAPMHPLRELLAELYPQVRVVDAPPGRGAMDMVLAGTADAAVEIKLYANLRINDTGGHRLRMLAEVPELAAQVHFANRKEHTVLLGLVDRALADIDPSERQRMLRRWVAIDLQPAFPWRLYFPWISAASLMLVLLTAATVWWTRRLQAEVKARRRSEKLLSDIGTAVPGLAFRYVLGPLGELRHNFFTPGAQAFLGRHLDPKLSLLDVLAPHIRPEDRDAVRLSQAHSQASGEPFRLTCHYAHPDGRLLWLHAKALRSLTARGQMVWTGYVVDVTTEHELQQRLTQEAESLNLMLASASHELRAPTHTLSLALQSLSPQGLDADQRHAVALARQSADILAELLTEVLDAARDGHDALRLRPCVFDLHVLLSDLAAAWRAAAQRKGLAFDLDIAPDVPRTLQSDPSRLKQVLVNLLSNACKYTEQGTLTLHVERLPSDDLRLTVIDTGIGISAADQVRLFSPFVTLNDPGLITGQPGSTGLGLATCRRIAALLGGRMQLQSHLGQGSEFSLLLPLGACLTAARMPLAAPQAATEGSILVCDDDDTSRLLMVSMLQRRGFDTQDSGTAVQALELWRNGGVRALVTDLELPGMGGLDLIRQLRREEAVQGRHTSVIVASGRPAPAVEDALDPGLYDAYLVKPVDMDALTDTLNQLGVRA